MIRNLPRLIAIPITVAVLASAGCSGKPQESTAAREPTQKIDVRYESQKALAEGTYKPQVQPHEEKDQYIKSVQKVGGPKAPIYYKELLKNPHKFEGQRLGIRGRILQIEEKNSETSLQIIINDRFDSVMVHYPGTMKIYEGDIIAVYGEGAGVIEGANRMGAAMAWPAMKAKYIVKIRSAEEYE